MKHIDVILRCCIGTTPQWQFYSLGVSTVGGANTLADAKLAALEALDFELDGEKFEVSFHTEMLGAEATNERPAVWVRALQDSDCVRRVDRQQEQVDLIHMMQSQRELVDRTFDSLRAATDDYVAIVGFEDDTVESVTRQTSPIGSIWVGVANRQTVTWFGMDATARGQDSVEMKTLEEVGITLSSTLGDLVRATNRDGSQRQSEKRLIAV